MKANELMIGDWVSFQGKEIIQVKEIDKDSINNDHGDMGLPCDMLQPIPLTAEILENDGWEKIGSSRTYIDEQKCVLANYRDNKWQMAYGGIDDYTRIPSIRYVHQLQHALRLCNIEKEIKL